MDEEILRKLYNRLMENVRVLRHWDTIQAEFVKTEDIDAVFKEFGLTKVDKIINE